MQRARKRWLIASVLLIAVCIVGFLFLREVVELTNWDRLVVLNSELEALSETELKGKIALDHARVLSIDEVNRIRELLVPENRHLTKDTFGREFRIRLEFNAQTSRKRLVAYADSESSVPRRRETENR